MLILQPGLLAFYSTELSAGEHSHSAIQVVWPVAAGGWQLNESDEFQVGHPLLVVSGLRHKLRAKQCWVILLERHSSAGKAAAQMLAKQANHVLNALPLDPALKTKNTTCLLMALLGVNEQNVSGLFRDVCP